MFLIYLKANGSTTPLFLHDDPRRHNYKGPVERVKLRYDDEERGRPDPDAPRPCYGRDPDEPDSYRQFTSRDAVRDAGWVPLAGAFHPPCHCEHVFGEPAWK